MAGIRFTLNPGEIATGTSKKTVLQIVAAANHRVKVSEWGISFKGVSSTASPILVQLIRQTTAGTMTSLTPEKIDASTDETLQTTANHTATAEPTGSTIIDSVEVHPQAGYSWQARFGEELLVAGGGRLGIAVTASADVNCVPTMKAEE